MGDGRGAVRGGYAGSWTGVAWAAVTMAVTTVGPLAGQDAGYENLHVLDPDVTREDLNAAMIRNLRGLGLPRRQNEGCLFCHVGSMDRPASTWDFASDRKATKRKAREMMAMVEDINRRLGGLEARVAPDLEVTCYTCHAGRTDPRPIEDVLVEAYDAGGADAVVARYRELRERYFGADAYDFRVGVLSGIAQRLATRGAYDDALRVSALNEEVFPDDASAPMVSASLRVQQALREEDVDAALAEFERLRAARPEAVGWSVLDGIGWGYYRADLKDVAYRLFRKNLETFPDVYVPHESLADALWFDGRRDEAIAGFEAWLEHHPDHVMARRRLATLLEGG